MNVSPTDLLLLSLVFLGSVLVGAFCLVGLGWLLFRRCRTTLAQLLAALCFYGLALAFLKNWLEQVGREERFMPFSVCLALTVGLGVFMGSRNAQRVPEAQRLTRWILFTSGLALPATILPALITTGMLCMGESPFRGHPLGVFIWLLLLTPAVTMFFGQVFIQEQAAADTQIENRDHPYGM